jgi:hypothetical protein
MGIIAHGTVENLALAPPLAEFIDQEQLRHEVSRQTIRGRDEHPLEGRKGGSVPEPVQPGPVECGSAVAIIAVDMRLRQVPVGLGSHLVPEPGNLLCNRLRLLWPGGRDPDIQRNGHGGPPSQGVMAQAWSLPHAPSPLAEGTGMHSPTVVHRRPVPLPHDAPARAFAWVPPASRVSDTQKDTLLIGLATKPQWAPPPREVEFAPAGAAKFVLCDHTIEIAIRDANAFAGLGQEQGRKHQRIVGANTVRLVLAAARTLGFIDQVERGMTFTLCRYRPWYRQKAAPSQLDVAEACRDALHEAGIFPLPRFTPELAENDEEPEHALPLAA